MQVTRKKSSDVAEETPSRRVPAQPSRLQHHKVTDRGAANVMLVVGFSRVFGIGGLVRVPEYLDPSIR